MANKSCHPTPVERVVECSRHQPGVGALFRSPMLALRILLFIAVTTWAVGCKGTESTGPRHPVTEVEDDPATLEEAHCLLERQLPQEELAKIDAMKSEDEMIEYHFGLGMGMRNGWGLWAGSPLAQHMRKLGFAHPDDMSGVILETFWCKRHGEAFRLKERAEYYAAYWKAVADPPETIKDPNDGSRIEWSFSFGAGEMTTPRMIHIGRSERTGRWVAYEFDKGVYSPDPELLIRIAELDAQR
jgi:hypothetical protein